MTARAVSAPPRGIAEICSIAVGKLVVMTSPVAASMVAAETATAAIAASSKLVMVSIRTARSSIWSSSIRARRPWCSVKRPSAASARTAKRARARPLANSARTLGRRSPAMSASIIPRPDTPWMSDSTEEIFTKASSRSFSMRCLTRVRSPTRSKQARARSRTRRIGSAGTKDADTIDRSTC
jgi:hypothetical protein